MKNFENNRKFLDFLFEYDGYACKCEKDIKYYAPDSPPKVTLKICADQSKPVHFSYFPRQGLNLTKPTGGVIDDNILGRFLGVRTNSIDELISFIETYGFLFPVSSEEYASIDKDDLLEIVRRLQSTLTLMNSLAKKDYGRILTHATYLLYSDPISFNYGSGSFSSCRHPFSVSSESGSLFPDFSADPEVFTMGTYRIEDSFIGEDVHENADFLSRVRSMEPTGVAGTIDEKFIRLAGMYAANNCEDPDTKYLIDFYYNFQRKYSIISDVKLRQIYFYDASGVTDLDDRYKEGLLKVARIVISEEINHAIKDISPRYDGVSLSPAWQVGSLLQALYFSIFYMKPGAEIYRECANPGCKRGGYFLVNASRINKEYCCPQCQQAAATRRSRARKRDEIKKAGLL